MIFLILSQLINYLLFNVFSYDVEKNVYLSKNDAQNAINLLLYEGHYCLIQDFNTLMYHITKHEGKKFFCMKCLHCCSSQKVLDNHIKHCSETTEIKMPEPGSTVEFKNWSHKLRVPYVIYADFESILKPVEEDVDEDDMDKESWTVKTQQHVPCGFGIYCVSDDPRFQTDPFIYRAKKYEKNVIDRFVKSLYKYKRMIEGFSREIVPVILIINLKEQNMELRKLLYLSYFII